jgi:hypothetical protein
MVSFFVLFILVILLVLFVSIIKIKNDARIDHIKLGFIMIEYSKLDKICYLVALVSLVIGVVIGMSMIWFESIDKLAAKIVGSLGLIFILCIGVLVLNRLIRSAGRFTE